MLYRSRALAEDYFHSFAMMLFAFSTFTSTVRLDYNCAFALLAFFFVLREKTDFSFNYEQLTVFCWLCLFSCFIDIAWIGLYSNADRVYDHSILHKLASTVRVVTIVSIMEFFVIKLPFVVMLFLVKGSDTNFVLRSIPRNDVKRPRVLSSYEQCETNINLADQVGDKQKPWNMQKIDENSSADPHVSKSVEVSEGDKQPLFRSVDNVSLEISADDDETGVNHNQSIANDDETSVNDDQTGANVDQTGVSNDQTGVNDDETDVKVKSNSGSVSIQEKDL